MKTSYKPIDPSKLEAKEKKMYEELSKSIDKAFINARLGDKTLFSAREVWQYCVGEGKPISWISSYKCILKYISEDFSYIFSPIIKGDKSGKRYYVKKDSLVEFLFRFETNQLDN